MSIATVVNSPPADTLEACDLYDDSDITDAAGDLVTGEPSSIREVAAALRRELYSGQWSAGDRFRTREDIADEHHVSAESAGVALRMLRAEGLVTLEQGRGTFVCKLSDYTVTVTIAADVATGPAPGVQISGDAAVTALRFDNRGDEWQWRMTVRAADAGRAAVTGLAVARRMAAPVTIDITRASVRSQAGE